MVIKDEQRTSLGRLGQLQAILRHLNPLDLHHIIGCGLRLCRDQLPHFFAFQA